MFIKRVKGGSKNNPIYYFQIAESYRSETGPKHRTICTVGRVDDDASCWLTAASGWLWAVSYEL